MKNTLTPFLQPKSIAVIGASRSKDKVGHQILKNIKNSGFTGNIYPINPNANSILSLPAYPSITDIGKPVDCAIVVTPAHTVNAILEQCAKAGTKHIIIITAGFAESGTQIGQGMQNAINQTIQKHQLHVLGPNCLGVLNPHLPVNATFGPPLNDPGSIFLISQSGALVTGLLDLMHETKLNLSGAVTLGNRINVSENDALRYAHQDPNTHTIMVYLESFQNAHQFFSRASTIARDKPILLLKGGQSSAGQAASASHTASKATNYRLIKSFCEQTGVTLCKDIDEWLHTATFFSQIKDITGPDLAIITNAGGPGVLATDLADQNQLDIEPLTQKTKDHLKTALERIHPNNPLDILGDALPEHFAAAIDIVDKDYVQDALMVIITPQTTTQPEKTAQLIIRKRESTEKPIVAVLLGGDKLKKAAHMLKEHDIPTFTYPTDAINLIHKRVAYHQNQSTLPAFPGNQTHYLDEAKKSELNKKLSPPPQLETAFELLKAYRITLPKYAIINLVSHIPDALNHVGRPAVMKTANLELAHKAKAGGVYLNINTNPEARMRFRSLQQIGGKVLVQQTIAGKAELILGTMRDEQLGPFVTVGLGGSHTDALDDRAFAFMPTSKTYLKKVFSNTKAAAILNEPQTDQVVELLHKLGTMLHDFPQIKEMEINPVIVTKNSIYAADIKLTFTD